MSDLLANLNAPQLAAVTLPAQHALILAGAGSGKTRVLTTRIAWLISTGQVGPQGILAVTFTNKAAKEMQSRLAAMLPINTRGMWIGTFHGLCNRLLRAHYREAGLPAQFQILDAVDQLAAIKRLLKNLNVDDQKFPPRELMHFINAHKEQGLRAAQAEAYDVTSPAAGSSCIPNMRRSAGAKGWSTSPNCCCARTNCCNATSRSASIIRRVSGISWSMNSRTPTASSMPG
jgi:DNA helicase-2/ATP-dependent DNA helicase PcrA